MSSIGVTGKKTSSGGSGRYCRGARRSRGSCRRQLGRRAPRRARQRSCPMPMPPCSWLVSPQDDQAEVGEALLLGLGQGAPDHPVRGVAVGPQDHHGRQLDRRGRRPSLSQRAQEPARRRALAWSAHQADAFDPSSTWPSTSSAP